MNVLRILRAALYIAVGLFITITHEALAEYAGYVVGSSVLIYVVEQIRTCFREKKLFTEGGSLFEAIVLILISLLLFATAKDIEKVCLIWGIWTIIRESREMTEAIKRIIAGRPGAIAVAESVVIITMAVFMTLDPGIHQATLHILLLGLEFMFEMIIETVDYLYTKRSKKKAEKLSSGEKLNEKLGENLSDAQDDEAQSA